MHINRPLIVIIAILAFCTAIAVLEQRRITLASDLPISAMFISSSGQSRQLELNGGKPLSSELDGGSGHIELNLDETKKRAHRVRITMTYQAEGSGHFTISLLQQQGFQDFNLQANGENAQIQTWKHNCVIPPGKFRMNISGDDGLKISIVNLHVKSMRSTASGPDFGGKIPFLALLILIAIPIYWFLHKRIALSQWFLVAISLVAMFVIQPYFALGMFVFLAVVFAFRKGISAGTDRARYLFVAILLTVVVYLMVFKYAPDWYYSFFIFIGGQYVGLPLGVSYFTFRLLHVVIEWYRQRRTDLTFREYLCFLLFLPTIPAGPIETMDGFFGNRLEKLDIQTVGTAVTRILLGLFKKIVLVGLLISPILFDPSQGLFDIATGNPWDADYLSIFCFLCLCLLYAYLDLSAYSDLAIGIGLLFGYRIRENFDWPIFKPNIAEFWRSYHMSLSSWCQNNVYFPVLMLTRITPLALYLSMLTMGLWHHINLNWLFWGLHHGTGLVWIMLLGDWTHKYLRKKKIPKALEWSWKPIRVCLTFCFVSGGTALVFIDDIATATTLYFRFFTFH